MLRNDTDLHIVEIDTTTLSPNYPYIVTLFVPGYHWPYSTRPQVIHCSTLAHARGVAAGMHAALITLGMSSRTEYAPSLSMND